MRSKTILLKAVFVLASTTMLLAFTTIKFGQGTIHCFDWTIEHNINPQLSCNNWVQPTGTRIDYIRTTHPLDPTTNPCPLDLVPYESTWYGSCIKTYPGVHHYYPTLP